MGFKELFKEGTESKKAIAYYRHSAEDKQENSVKIQEDHAKKYAERYNIELIHYEADEGKSGLLGPEERPGFDSLFQNWIKNPDSSKINYILVYDESRWGRFQNENAASHYEYLCNEQGVDVIYLSDGISPEDQKSQLGFKLNKAIKRHMASQFSADLSNKVFYGCVKVSEQGYSAGGTAPYGLSRILLDESKKPIRILKHGEHKMISNQRVTFTPSNNQKTEVVKRIFDLFVNKDFNIGKIADRLNIDGIPSPSGKKWREGKILRILRNENYIGTRVYNKTWNRLKKGHRNNPRSDWVFCPNAFEAIIDKDIFDLVQEKLNENVNTKNKGKINILKVHYLINRELERILIERGFSPDEIFIIKDNFPISFSITAKGDNAPPSWCFTIKEEFRQCNTILCVGVSIKKDKLIDNFFVVPSEEFDVGNFKFISKNEIDYRDFSIKEEELDKEIINLLEELKINHCVQ